MKARLGAWLERLGDQFWLRPAFIVAACMAAAEGGIWMEHARSFMDGDDAANPWGYGGGAEGARALLSAVASSSIGVAGTVFSITVAALSLASGQMGPRLLRNFVRDGRNQLALGIFVGTFAYAILVLRTVRTEQEGAFVPHAAVTGAIVLAVACVATLVWFVHHVAMSINVEKVVEAVHRDLVEAVERATLDAPDLMRVEFEQAATVTVSGSEYLQAVDPTSLADWAASKGCRVRLRVRPGDYVPRGLPIAEIHPSQDGARSVLERALTFGSQPTALQALEYTVRQLSEVAVRALSPGINDPSTAGSVLERFGDALCRLAPRFLPTGVAERDGRIVLLYPVTDYEGLTDAMFHAIRQNGSGSAFVLIRMLDVLAKVAQVERATDRLWEIRRSVRRGWIATAILAVTILLVALSVVPVAFGFFGAALLLVLFRAVPTREAYDAIDWPILVMLAALIPYQETHHQHEDEDGKKLWGAHRAR
ncbi:DUF2254 family protein [uncultured Enterovirga sp.]|uniref:DUF2254 domain-containing protein n=1 Tax=uncultured Enterovirga sp. TaxID=2026352 RepID=UPI0035C9EBF5